MSPPPAPQRAHCPAREHASWGRRTRHCRRQIPAGTPVSSRLEAQNRNLTQIEVDEVLRFVRHIAAKVATDNHVPGGPVLLVELLLNVCRREQRREKTRRKRSAERPSHRQLRDPVSSRLGNAHAAMSFSMLNFSIAWLAQSTQSCCMSSDMSAFLMIACRSRQRTPRKRVACKTKRTRHRHLQRNSSRAAYLLLSHGELSATRVQRQVTRSRPAHAKKQEIGSMYVQNRFYEGRRRPSSSK